MNLMSVCLCRKLESKLDPSAMTGSHLFFILYVQCINSTSFWAHGLKVHTPVMSLFNDEISRIKVSSEC